MATDWPQDKLRTAEEVMKKIDKMGATQAPPVCALHSQPSLVVQVTLCLYIFCLNVAGGLCVVGASSCVKGTTPGLLVHVSAQCRIV